MLEGDYFARLRAELGFDRVDHLARVQAWCDQQYPGSVRVKRLHQGVLRVVTPSAGVAGALRMRQVELLGLLPAGESPTRLSVSIASLD